MKKALIIFGGASSEHFVSCVSASYVISHIPTDKYEVVTVGITRDGEWYLYEGDVSLLPEDKWLESGNDKCPLDREPWAEKIVSVVNNTNNANNNNNDVSM